MLSAVGLTLGLESDIRVYKKDGEEYVEFLNPKTSSDIKRAYFYLENSQSPGIGAKIFL